MENDQQSHADSEANHHAPPEPVACHPCLTLFSHERSLLPPRRRGKGKCPTSAMVPVSHCVPRALASRFPEREAMNPDKLFDYLEGKLPATERAALEERLMSDKQLQRELAVARQIHAGMRGDSREVLLPPEPDVTEQGRKMALRVGGAFIILMAVNVGFGLWLIARHETRNPNRALLETQIREQIAKSLEHAAATLTPAPDALGVSEIMIPAATGKLDAVADQVVTIASRLGGSATKGLPDRGRLSILVDLPANRESEFRAAIASIGGGPASSAFAEATADKTPPATATSPAAAEKKSFVVQIAEEPAKSD